MALARVELACWQDIRYLVQGGQRQRQAYAVLHHLQILAFLAPFDAVLIGTIPIDLDIPGSDLDIACCAADLDALAALIAGRYGHSASYAEVHTAAEDGQALVVNTAAGGFPIQIFAQTVSVVRQRGYRHMLIEDRLLALAGPSARVALRALKAAGLKTEPAFAHYFNLSGDPYEVLYTMSDWPNARLRAWYRAERADV